MRLVGWSVDWINSNVGESVSATLARLTQVSCAQTSALCDQHSQNAGDSVGVKTDQRKRVTCKTF